MAETEIEELLDFDGSDYEFGSDEGGGEEDDVEYGVAEENAGNEADPAEEQVRTRDSRETSGPGEPDKPPDHHAVERSGGRMPQGRNPRNSSKNDLEDGELSDMAMVNKKQTEHGAVKDGKHTRKHHSETMRDTSDREADSRQDRKRRRDHDYERYQYSNRSRKQPHDRYNTGRYDRSHESDRRYDRFEDIPDARTRGPPFFRPNHSPGIMGPGRLDMTHIRACTAGLEVFSPAQLQELLNQEHMLRTQQMVQLARLGIRPPPGQHMYPVMGPNMFRPPLQPDMNSRMNFMGPLGPQSCFPPPGRSHGAGSFGFARLSGNDGRSQQLRQRDSESRRSESASDATTLERNKRAKQPSKANDIAGNVIQLGGPVQKSRVLTISGLLQNTPMSAVADAFEKQGKILDFRKNQTGDVFTIEFSSVEEAVSAKRHLHRSMLAGRQITVEYAVG